MQIADYNLTHQRVWSERTFGPGERTKGVIAHIRSELDEVAAAPGDLSEWCDLLILAFDGAMRQGFSGADVIAGYHAKMRENYRRKWPDWRNFSQDEPIEHVRDNLVKKVDRFDVV